MVRKMVSNFEVHDCEAITIRLLKRLWGDQPCPNLSNVRRNLFGFCEEKVMQKDRRYHPSLDDEFRKQAKKASQEWNFDFVKGVPLPGKYVWQRVDSCDVPSWYAAVNRPTFKDACRRDQDEFDERSVIKTNIRLPQSETEIRLTKLEEDQERKTEQPSCKKPRLVQTSMKDFTRVQKRRSSRRLQLKQLQLYCNRLRNHHHHFSMHSRGVTSC